MRISLVAKLLSCKALAIDVNTLVLANRVKCVAAKVLATNAHNWLPAGDFSCYYCYRCYVPLLKSF